MKSKKSVRSYKNTEHRKKIEQATRALNKRINEENPGTHLVIFRKISSLNKLSISLSVVSGVFVGQRIWSLFPNVFHASLGFLVAFFLTFLFWEWLLSNFKDNLTICLPFVSGAFVGYRILSWFIDNLQYINKGILMMTLLGFLGTYFLTFYFLKSLGSLFKK